MKYKLTIAEIEQMFCEEEGILTKFTEVNQNTISQWLEEKGLKKKVNKNGKNQ